MQRKLVLFFATGGGVGFIPGARGTYGTIVALLLFWAVRGLPLVNYVLFVIAFSFFAIWISGLAEVYFQEADCQKIVIDEIAGYLVTMFLIPVQWKYVLAGFVAFRLFDILKPFPIRLIDQKLKGGWGIVCDDLLAGVFANLVLQVIIRIL
jgi:phosphatidylglycerophosphatase A